MLGIISAAHINIYRVILLISSDKFISINEHNNTPKCELDEKNFSIYLSKEALRPILKLISC